VNERVGNSSVATIRYVALTGETTRYQLKREPPDFTALCTGGIVLPSPSARLDRLQSRQGDPVSCDTAPRGPARDSYARERMNQGQRNAQQEQPTVNTYEVRWRGVASSMGARWRL
jgi:hypothetical protein